MYFTRAFDIMHASRRAAGYPTMIYLRWRVNHRPGGSFIHVFLSDEMKEEHCEYSGTCVVRYVVAHPVIVFVFSVVRKIKKPTVHTTYVHYIIYIRVNIYIVGVTACGGDGIGC